MPIDRQRGVIYTCSASHLQTGKFNIRASVGRTTYTPYTAYRARDITPAKTKRFRSWVVLIGEVHICRAGGNVLTYINVPPVAMRNTGPDRVAQKFVRIVMVKVPIYLLGGWRIVNLHEHTSGRNNNYRPESPSFRQKET
jgi:hypothetical protein